MLTNPNDPINPSEHRITKNMGMADQMTVVERHTGLTKLEYFAAMALQGLMSNSNMVHEGYDHWEIVTDAILMAHGMVEELNREKKDE